VCYSDLVPFVRFVVYILTREMLMKEDRRD
jgi:hypothetical protein